MPFSSMIPKRICSHRVDFDKGHGLDQLDNNGPYKVVHGSGNEVFPEKEDPFKYSYRIDRPVDSQTYGEVHNLQRQLHQLRRGQHS